MGGELVEVVHLKTDITMLVEGKGSDYHVPGDGASVIYRFFFKFNSPITIILTKNRRGEGRHFIDICFSDYNFLDKIFYLKGYV